MVASEVIRVLLCDDQVLVRSGLKALLSAHEDLEIVAEAEDGAQAHRVAKEHRPDVILMDIRMPGVDGLEGTRRIIADPDLADTRIVVLTTFDLDEYVFESLRAGAAGFLLKHAEPDEIARAVRVVAAGDSLLSPQATRRLVAAFVSGESRSPTVPHPRAVELLTTRELEVVVLVAEGRSNSDIARSWWISEATVRTHVSRAMSKLNARDRAQLVVFAYQYGLADPPAASPHPTYAVLHTSGTPPARAAGTVKAWTQQRDSNSPISAPAPWRST